MLASSAGNVAVQIGDDGVLLVDTGPAPMAPKLFAAVRTLSNKPIHTIVNTHLHSDHTGGNQALVKLGAGGPQAPRVMGHENTLQPDDGAPRSRPTRNTPASALPMNTFFTPTRDFFLNGEAIVLHHAAGCAHRRRHARALPRLRRRQRRRRVQPRPLPRHRHRQRRHRDRHSSPRSTGSSRSPCRRSTRRAAPT